MQIVFVETSEFTRRVTRLRLEDDLRQLQIDLLEIPERECSIQVPVACAR